MMMTPHASAARRGATSAMLRFLEARRHMSSPIQEQPPMLAFEEVYSDAKGRLAASTSGGAAGVPPPSGRKEEGGERDPFTAVFLHGLLGSSRNWRTYCRGLAQACSLEHGRPYRLILADLRAHGRSAALAPPSSSSPSSPPFGPPHTLEAAARDVRDLLARHPAFSRRAPDALVGLSLGGKVALEVVRQQQQQIEQGAAGASSAAAAPPSPGSPPLLLPRQVWVLDSQPGLVEREGDGATSVGRIMRLLRGVPQPLRSRQSLYDRLVGEGVPLAVAQWLGGALQQQQVQGQQQQGQQQQQQGQQQQRRQQQQANGGGLVWEFDAPSCAELYRSYGAADLWPVMERPPAGVSVHLVRGELSDRWDEPGALERVQEAESRWRRAADEAAAAAAGADANAAAAAASSPPTRPGGVGELRVHLLEKATHWLQASNPQGLTRMLVPYFN